MIHFVVKDNKEDMIMVRILLMGYHPLYPQINAIYPYKIELEKFNHR
jgi:hypothetical protein